MVVKRERYRPVGLDLVPKYNWQYWSIKLDSEVRIWRPRLVVKGRQANKSSPRAALNRKVPVSGIVSQVK